MNRRVIVNDYPGHAFPVQLSRSLARRGYDVLHTYYPSFLSPRGPLSRLPSDPSSLDIRPIGSHTTFRKYNPLSRLSQERALGRALVAEARTFAPQAIISVNALLVAQAMLVKASSNLNSKFIYWVQDLVGVAIERILKKKIPMVGTVAGAMFKHMENRLLRRSSEVVVISEDFFPLMRKAGVDQKKLHVVHNWAPINDLITADKHNRWSRALDLEADLCVIYSGTLGLKHDPDKLVRLALRLLKLRHVKLIVISEGMGADYLQKQKHELGLNNLILLGFQKYEDFPYVLATADVLIAILSSDAGIFSVPSKILSYLCTGKPVVLSAPRENLAARIINENSAGIVVQPDDTEGFVENVISLLEDTQRRDQFGRNGLKYARKHFDIEAITDRFEDILALR